MVRVRNRVLVTMERIAALVALGLGRYSAGARKRRR